MSIAMHPATYADLEALPSNIKGEILDGVLYTRRWPGALECAVKGNVAGTLWQHFDRGRRQSANRWLLVMEPGIALPRAVELAPTIVGWRRSTTPQFPAEEDRFRVVPDWICEVLSPDYRKYVVCTKRRFYAEIGVQFMWTVDPREQLLTVDRLHEGRWLELGVYADDERVRAQPFEDLEIDLSTWWE